MSRQMQSTPLVICVLDKFASGGGLLRTYAGQDVSFALQVKYSFAGHLGEGGEDLRNWVESNGNFTCVLTGPTEVHAGENDDVFFVASHLVPLSLSLPQLCLSVCLSLNSVCRASEFRSFSSGQLCIKHSLLFGYNISLFDYTSILTCHTHVAADVVYQGAGTFVFFYKPTLAGKYLVSVRLGQGDVPGSPFESFVEPGV